MVSESVLERLRSLCLALPGTSERTSHGEPTWFVGTTPKSSKVFVMLADRHHDDRIGFWCAAPEGAQSALVTAEPERYFVPPYVGHRGWLGVYLDSRERSGVPLDWVRIAEAVEDAHRVVAPKRLRA